MPLPLIAWGIGAAVVGAVAYYASESESESDSDSKSSSSTASSSSSKQEAENNVKKERNLKEFEANKKRAQEFVQTYFKRVTNEIKIERMMSNNDLKNSLEIFYSNYQSDESYDINKQIARQKMALSELQSVLKKFKEME